VVVVVVVVVVVMMVVMMVVVVVDGMVPGGHCTDVRSVVLLFVQHRCAMASGDIMPSRSTSRIVRGCPRANMASKCAVSLAPHAHPRSSSCKDVCRPCTSRYAAAELVLTTAMAISTYCLRNAKLIPM
jgi:hypothetical protein